MELSDKELSMIANALYQEFSRLARYKNGRDMLNNTVDDYISLIARVYMYRGENE